MVAATVRFVQSLLNIAKWFVPTENELLSELEVNERRKRILYCRRLLT